MQQTGFKPLLPVFISQFAVKPTLALDLVRCCKKIRRNWIHLAENQEFSIQWSWVWCASSPSSIGLRGNTLGSSGATEGEMLRWITFPLGILLYLMCVYFLASFLWTTTHCSSCYQTFFKVSNNIATILALMVFVPTLGSCLFWIFCSTAFSNFSDISECSID